MISRAWCILNPQIPLPGCPHFPKPLAVVCRLRPKAVDKGTTAVQEAALSPPSWELWVRTHSSTGSHRAMRPCPTDDPLPSTVIPLKPAAVVLSREPGASLCPQLELSWSSGSAFQMGNSELTHVSPPPCCL